MKIVFLLIGVATLVLSQECGKDDMYCPDGTGSGTCMPMKYVGSKGQGDIFSLQNAKILMSHDLSGLIFRLLE